MFENVCAWTNRHYSGGALFFYTHYLSVFTTCWVWKNMWNKANQFKKLFKEKKIMNKSLLMYFSSMLDFRLCLYLCAEICFGGGFFVCFFAWEQNIMRRIVQVGGRRALDRRVVNAQSAVQQCACTPPCTVMQLHCICPFMFNKT